MSPELLLLGLNVTILLLAYCLVYPRFVRKNIIKLMQSDALATAASVIVAGYLFWGKNHSFDLIFGQVNWFVFSLVTFMLIEVPFAIWYLRKFDLRM